MRTVKLSNKEYAIYGSGDTAVICENEFHEDMFELMDECTAMMSGAKTRITPLSKMMYAFIKTANPEAVGGYRSFMQSVRKVNEFISADNFLNIIEEIMEVMDLGKTSGTEENSDDAKKKTGAKKD